MQYLSFIISALPIAFVGAQLSTRSSISINPLANGVLPTYFQPRFAIGVDWNATTVSGSETGSPSMINGTSTPPGAATSSNITLETLTSSKSVGIPRVTTGAASPAGTVSGINSSTASNMASTTPPDASTSGGISKTSSSTMITSTLTSPPPAMSTEHVTHTEWSENTWFTTIHNGHSTIVPVLVGCPTCGGQGEGIIIWDFPIMPDVSFQFPEFPDLPDFHLPCIKIFGVPVTDDCSIPPADDNADGSGPPELSPSPSNEPTETNAKTRTTPTSQSTLSSTSSSSSSSESCPLSATKTASDCNVFCTSTTGTITQSCTTTCYLTTVGCSATGITSTSSSVDSCIAAVLSGVQAGRDLLDDRCGGSCPATLPVAPTSGSLAIPSPVADPSQHERRVIAGRVVHVISKRMIAQTIVAINNCILVTPPGMPVTTPAYPGGFEFWQSDLAGNLDPHYQTISRYYITTQIGCHDTVTKVAADPGVWKPQRGTGDTNQEVSIDHAYENGWLQPFMESIIDTGLPDSLTCPETNAIFFDLRFGCMYNYMDTWVYGNLASETNPDFIAMSQYLNGNAKGKILGSQYSQPDDLDPIFTVDPTWTWANARDNIDHKLGTLNTITLGCLTVNAPNLIEMIQKTNLRIYYGFWLIDLSISQTPSLPRQGFNFADKYKTFMNNYVTLWNSVPGFQRNLITNIRKDLAASTELVDWNKVEWQSLFQMWQDYVVIYGGATNPAAYNIVLDWPLPTKQDLEIVKRLMKRDGTCSRSNSSSSEIIKPSSSVAMSASASSGTMSSAILTSSISNSATPGSSFSSFVTASATPSSSISQLSSPITMSQSSVSASVGALATPFTSIPLLTSCKLVQTTLTGSTAPGPQTYCSCGELVVGINTGTQSGTVYSICAGPPYPTIASSILSESSSTTPPSSSTQGFVMTATTLSCGGKFGWGKAVPTSIPRDQTNYILDAIIHFCTPNELHDGILKLRQGEFAFQGYRIPKSKYGVFQIMLLWDSRPECSAIPAPEFRVTPSGGPDHLCMQFLDIITNTCDAQDGQNKNGGTLETNCVFYGWEAFELNTVEGVGRYYEGEYHFANETDGWTIGDS